MRTLRMQGGLNVLRCTTYGSLFVRSAEPLNPTARVVRLYLTRNHGYLIDY